MKFIDYLDAEREEISKNRWYMSEKAHHDVGFAAALVNWLMFHKSAFVKSFNSTYEKTHKAEGNPNQPER